MLGLIGSPLLAQSNANTELRIRGYSSYVELKDGTVFCGDNYNVQLDIEASFKHQRVVDCIL